MKASTLAIIGIAGLAAIASGWVYESQSLSIELQPELEIPADIDYFLRAPSFRVINNDGKLDYQLQSRYLEHYTQDDVSLIESPKMLVIRNGSRWQVEAAQGEMSHQQNSVQLIDRVVMVRQGSGELRVEAGAMLFEPDFDRIGIAQQLSLQSGNAIINGENAVFDLGKNTYTINNAKAVYRNEKS